MAKLLVSCNKCNVKCAPVYRLSPKVNDTHYICRSCALELMEGYYDRRPIETEKAD